MTGATWDDAGNLQISFNMTVDTYTDPGGLFLGNPNPQPFSFRSSAGIVFGGTAVDARWDADGGDSTNTGTLTYIGADGEISSGSSLLLNGTSCPLVHI